MAVLWGPDPRPDDREILGVVDLTGHLRTAHPHALARERLLPASSAARVVEARERLEDGLRTAALDAHDAGVLSSWCRSVPGQEDEAAAHALLALLEPHDVRAAAAHARLQHIAVGC